MMPVRADLLLKGAWYAVEQSSLLLTNAIDLYSTKGYASAVLLALLAREELGRCSILLDLWRKASGGTEVSPEEVRKACDDHIEKQREGQLSMTYRAQGAGGFGKLLQERSKAKPGTPEYAELDGQLKDIDDLKAKRTPQDRHSSRVRATYVDLNEMGTDWNRPILLSQSEACSCLTDAINDYSLKQDRLTQLDILKVTDPELAAAVGGWNDRPALPPLISIWREKFCI